jgi:hypothetical protein
MPVNLFNMAWQKGRMDKNHTLGRCLNEHLRCVCESLPVAVVDLCGER